VAGTGRVLPLARGLNLPAVVEAVETRDQLDVLRSLGCETVQGSLLGRPEEASMLPRRLSFHQDRVFLQHQR
jgi:EAL domain-containing protein (putative c-di-GMP-specific phosphodiesterase class I)